MYNRVGLPTTYLHKWSSYTIVIENTNTNNELPAGYNVLLLFKKTIHNQI